MAMANWSTIGWPIVSVLASLVLLQLLHALAWFLSKIWTRRVWRRSEASRPQRLDTLPGKLAPVVNLEVLELE